MICNSALQEYLMTWAVPSLKAAKIRKDVTVAELWAEKVKVQKSNRLRTEGQGIHSAQ